MWLAGPRTEAVKPLSEGKFGRGGAGSLGLR
jgi:hypothetical protein